MLTSYPVFGWEITHVSGEHIDNPDPTRKARVLLQRSGETSFLLPTFCNQFRISGYEIQAEELESDSLTEWREITPRVAWRPREWPVIDHSADLLSFVDTESLTRDRRCRASDLIVALLTSTDVDALDLVSRLEYFDDTLGGSAVVRSALFALWREENSPKIRRILGDSEELLASRLRASVYSFTGFERAILKNGYNAVRAQPNLVDKLKLAASDAFSKVESFTNHTWADLRNETLEAWRQQARLAIHRLYPSNQPDDARVLEHVFHADPDPLLLSMLGVAHQKRLSVFAEQFTALERRYPTGALEKWEKIRAELVQISDRLAARPHQIPWRAAQTAARLVRRVLGIEDDAPVNMADAVQSLGGYVAGVTLPAARANGGWIASSGCLPLLFLSPHALGYGSGALRFALARQFGSLVEGMMRRDTSPWSLTGECDPLDSDRDEAFSNAFAVYFIAPRVSVNQVVDRPQGSVVDPEWVYSAAEAVAQTFGLSAGAAIAHVVNGIERVAKDKGELLRTLRSDEHWHTYSRAVGESASWARDRDQLRTEAGTPEQTIEGALHRPQSHRFESLIMSAAEDDLFDDAVFADLQVPSAA